MKLYTNCKKHTTEDFGTMLELLYPLCDKVSIYFPNDGTDDVMSFKNQFLIATELCGIEDELSVLEPKEGFSMVIASIHDKDVQQLLKLISPELHLSFGIIKDETLVFFVDEEGEIAIDTDDLTVLNHPIFSKSIQLNN
ncbi:MAG: hypothetical protein ACRCSG_01995 [Cellulosilyticaceae bacterium]